MPTIYGQPPNPAAWDDFDPNTTPFAKWATYIPERRNSAAFQMHKTRGPALSAFSQRLRGILYEFDEHQHRWVERAKIDYLERPTECERCFADLTTGHWNEGKVTRIKPGLDYKFLCRNCARMVS